MNSNDGLTGLNAITGYDRLPVAEIIRSCFPQMKKRRVEMPLSETARMTVRTKLCDKALRC